MRYVIVKNYFKMEKYKRNNDIAIRVCFSLDNVTAENVSIKTEEFFRGNYLTVNIYYGSMTSLYVHEIPQVAPIEFVSELGKL